MHPFEAFSVPTGRIGIHWFGQSSFALKDPAGTIVQVDPYFPRERPPEQFIHADPPLDEASLKTDVVLLTHDHADHTCMESLLRIHGAFPDTRYVGPPESVARMSESGIPEGLLTAVTAGDVVSHAGITAHAVWAKITEGVYEEDIKPADVQHLGYVVELGSVRAYVSGDTFNTLPDHDEVLHPIAALRPDIGFLTTHPTEGEFPFFAGSVEMALKLGLRAAVPSHYGCFVTRTYDPEEWADGFPEHGPQPIVIPYNGSVIYPL